MACAGLKPRVIIVPGNGCSSKIRSCNFYGWLESELKKREFEVALKVMPDPLYARESNWIPFIVNDLAGGEEALANSIVVGHSSGAAAAMRLAESYRVHGIVLVSAYTTDLGDKTEAASGYFNRPWEWEKQMANAGLITQLASTDDPFLPIASQRGVGQEGLANKCKYVELDGRSHFFQPYPEILDVVLEQAGLQINPGNNS